MKEFLSSPYSVLRLGLFALFFYFGFNEVLKPYLWTGWIPGFISHSFILEQYPYLATILVIGHGIGSLVSAFLILSRQFVRLGTFGMILLLFPVVGFFGINDVTVRDFAILTAVITVLMDYTQTKS